MSGKKVYMETLVTAKELEDEERKRAQENENFSLVPAHIFFDEIKRIRDAKGEDGYKLPWTNPMNACPYGIRFRQGEVTIWAGENGSGKSMITSQVVLSLISQGAKVSVASFEMQPARTLDRMATQALKDRNCSYKDLEKWLEDTNRKLWIFKREGRSNLAEIVNLVSFSCRNYGVDTFVIDSLMMCVEGEGGSGLEAQKSFMTDIVNLAKSMRVHIHIVAHTRKSSGSDNGKKDLYDKDSIRGSSAITDLASNVFLIVKNKDKLKKKWTNKPFSDDEPDLVAACLKQRNGEWEGHIPLWFDYKSLQYCSDNQRVPFSFTIPKNV